jgi:large subunit ribosomal protein L29
MMNQSVIKQMTDEELVERLQDEKGSLIKLKLNHAVSQLENPVVIRNKRRAIARILTEMHKRNNNKVKA